VAVNHNVAEIAFKFEELPPDAHEIRRLLLLERNAWSQPGMNEQVGSGDEVRHRIGKKARVTARQRRVEALPQTVLGRKEGKLTRQDTI
jgi:hypothetical protein